MTKLVAFVMVASRVMKCRISNAQGECNSVTHTHTLVVDWVLLRAVSSTRPSRSVPVCYPDPLPNISSSSI